MDVVRNLWSSFADELEKDAGTFGKLEGLAKRLLTPQASNGVARIGTHSPAGAVHRALGDSGISGAMKGPPANIQLRGVSTAPATGFRAPHPGLPIGTEPTSANWDRWLETPGRPRFAGEGQPAVAAEMAKTNPLELELRHDLARAEAPPALDDLAGVNLWLKKRMTIKDKLSGLDTAELAPVGRSEGFTRRSGPYDLVQPFPNLERSLASTMGQVPRQRMSPMSLDFAAADEVARRAGKNPTLRTSDDIMSLPSEFLKQSRVTWVGFADELDKLAVRRYFLPDGRKVDLDLLEPLLDGRSIDTATEDEIEQSLIRPGVSQRLGSWFRQRIPFLFDEE